MPEKLSPEEVALVIRARRLLKAKGLAPDTDIKTICHQSGISRKTGYQWEKRLDDATKDDQSREAFERLKAEYEKLKKAYEEVRWENQGRKLAWEIHEVDALLAEKKALWPSPKTKSGSLLSVAKATSTAGLLGTACSSKHPFGLEFRL